MAPWNVHRVIEASTRRVAFWKFSVEQFRGDRHTGCGTKPTADLRQNAWHNPAGTVE